jgi:hypothetical protein
MASTAFITLFIPVSSIFAGVRARRLQSFSKVARRATWRPYSAIKASTAWFRRALPKSGKTSSAYGFNRCDDPEQGMGTRSAFRVRSAHFQSVNGEVRERAQRVGAVAAAPAAAAAAAACGKLQPGHRHLDEPSRVLGVHRRVDVALGLALAQTLNQAGIENGFNPGPKLCQGGIAGANSLAAPTPMQPIAR